ncbi:MAG TPA: patatin-like phospholipase family protein [Flavobacteriales bacterium]|nr:patatin-like phospholipase family protein [Flavobacteriales bacterium]
MKRLLLIGDMKSMKLRGGFGGGAPTMTDSRISTQLFNTHDNAATYLQSLLMGRGLFSGYAARKFFRELIKNRLVAAHFAVYKGTVPLNPDLSFREFYNITGVDLVVTGVNISQRVPRYFSVWHTPDFPVVEAVVLSMSIPFAFKPTYIEGGVRQGDTAQDAAYRGLYVDGGMLNNYPVRAFDTIAKRSTLSTGEPILFQGKDVAEIGGVFLAVDPKEGTAGNEPFLGFRLVDMGDANVAYDQDQGPTPDTRFKTLFPAAGNSRVGIDLLKDLYFTLMYPTSEGQIRYANDRSRTIPLNVHGLDVFDFAHPKADQMNNRIKSIIIDGKEKPEPLGQWKNDRITEAKLRNEHRITP